MLGCQVMNQSVENGSWPLLGLRPAAGTGAEQALVREIGLGFQHLQARTEVDQGDGALDLPPR